MLRSLGRVVDRITQTFLWRSGQLRQVADTDHRDDAPKRREPSKRGKPYSRVELREGWRRRLKEEVDKRVQEAREMEM